MEYRPMKDSVKSALLILGISAFVGGVIATGQSVFRGHPNPFQAVPASVPALDPAVAKALEKLPPEQREKALANYRAAIDENNRLIKEGEKDNQCRNILSTFQAHLVDIDGAQKLEAVKGACPQGVPLEETIKMVNTNLWCALHEPFTHWLTPAESVDLIKSHKGVKPAFNGGGIGLSLVSNPSKTLPPLPATTPAAAPVDPCTHEALPTDLLPAPSPRFQFTGLIRHVVPGSPADRSGLKKGWVITQIDGEDVVGQDETVIVRDKVHGQVGSPITLTVFDGTKTFSVTMNREVIIQDKVWSEDLGDNVVAIVIAEIGPDTAGKIVTEFLKSCRRLSL
jgi:hypothetical protein